jgi:hypothetical protein
MNRSARGRPGCQFGGDERGQLGAGLGFDGAGVGYGAVGLSAGARASNTMAAGLSSAVGFRGNLSRGGIRGNHAPQISR